MDETIFKCVSLVYERCKQDAFFENPLTEGTFDFFYLYYFDRNTLQSSFSPHRIIKSLSVS